MATKLQWFKDRPFLLWLGLWSAFFEVMNVLPRGKSSSSMFSVFYLLPALWTLLRCVRPVIAKYLRFLYGMLFLIAIPISTLAEWNGIIPIGIACFSALVMDLYIGYKMNGDQIKL